MKNVSQICTLVAFALLATATLKAQVAINNDGSPPHGSAMLDVKSTTRGLLPPRLTTLQRNAIGAYAVGGLIVYDTDMKKLFFHDGTSWSDVSSGTLWSRSGISTYVANTGDNVGIGTTSPGYIAGANRYLSVSTPTGGNQVASLELKGYSAGFSTAVPVSRVDFLAGDQNIARIESRTGSWVTDGQLLFFTKDVDLTERMKINQTGQVGIGTSSPGIISGASRYLSVSAVSAGNQIASLELIGQAAALTPQSAVSRIDFLSGDQNITRIESKIGNLQGSGQLLFYTRDGSLNERMRIDVKGNVGIGTTEPRGKLHIYDGTSTDATVFITPKTITGSGDSATIFLAEDHDATYGMYWTYDGTGNQMELWGKSEGSRFGPHLLVNRDNGNMAIGDAFASGYRLSVSGKVICTEVRVNLVADWPDYVFRKGYKLLPVEKLGAYIEENGHLPNIPAAAEMNKSGLDVGEMQRLMMEKIEELSLYIVEQQKQIRQLEDHLKIERK